MDEPRDRWSSLPDRPRPEDTVVEIPAFPDDRPAPSPVPPAAAPELIAATQIADANAVRRARMRRPGLRAGLIVGAIPLGVAFVLALIVALGT